MEELLRTIFAAYGYTVSDIEAGSEQLLYATSPLGRSAFYAVTFLKHTIPERFLDEYVPRYSTNIIYHLGANYKPDMPKNTTLLVCVDISEDEYAKLREDVQHVEEDPFDFKKHVLLYSEEQVRTFLGLWRSSEQTIGVFMQNQLYDHVMFGEFRQNPNALGSYNLLAQLYVNIPFLKLNPPQSEFGDLSKRIQESLDDKGLMELYRKIVTLPDGMDETQLQLSMFRKEE